MPRTRRRPLPHVPQAEGDTSYSLPIPHVSAVSSGHRHVTEGPSARNGDGDALGIRRDAGESRLERDRLTGLDVLRTVVGAQAPPLGIVGDTVDARGGRLNERQAIGVVRTPSRARLSAGLRN